MFENVSIEELKKRFESIRWKQFLSNFFGDNYMMWHDGYDPDAILNLTEEEKQVAEEMLLKSIPLNGMWSAAGLVLLRSHKAVAVMKEQLARTDTNIIKIRLADAIMQITHSENYVPVLIGCLQNAAFWSDRSEAARELRKYPSPGVIQALFGVVADEDYLVRYNACDSLLAIHGLPADVSQYAAIFANIREDKQKRKYASAHAQLKELFQNKGKSA